MEAIVKNLRRATHKFQPHYAKDSTHIRESTEEHLLHFSHQIDTVEENYMALVKDGYIPRKPTQWVKNATDLKSQVLDALKDQQNSNDPSLKYEKLKQLCDQIFEYMKHCPLEDVSVKPLPFIAWMHETENRKKEVACSDRKGKDTITSGSHSPNVQSLVSYGPTLNLRNKHMITSENMMGGGNVEGKSSQVHDVISQVQEVDENKNESSTIQEVDALEGTVAKNPPELFSAIRKPEELELISQSTLMGDQQPAGTLETFHTNGTLLPGNRIVNGSGSKSKEMPTDEQWQRASVVNLIEKNMLLLNEEPDCPNLVILFLQRNSRLTHIPSLFFEKMPSLHFLDLSDTRIKALPDSLFKLTNLQVLLLRSCVCLESLPAEVKNLINMKVLDLLGTYLSDLPKAIGELTQLRHLQLSFYRPDSGSKDADSQPELVSPGAVFALQALQGLSIAVHPKDQHWKRIVRDIIKQVGELKMLSYLEFYFPSVEALEYFSEVSLSWKEQRLTSFKFLVGHNIKHITSRVPHEVESKYEQYDRCLRFVNGNEVPEVMKGILKYVTAFYLDQHLEIQSLSEFDISNFKELKFCVLRECPNIQVMIIGEKRTESAFPNLEYLGLHYLWKLEQIWEDPVPPGSYQALKYLMIGTCGKLEYAASHSILQCLFNLETFIIEDCGSLKSIVKENEMVKYDDAPLLPRLKELVLRHLPQLVALGRGLFPSEEIISIHFCPKLILRPGHGRSEWKKLLESTICNAAQT